MKVYQVVAGYNYESEFCVGVYSSKAKADESAAKCRAENQYYDFVVVRCYEVQ